MDCFAAVFVFGTIDTRIFSMSFMYRDLIQLEVPLIIMKKSRNGDCSEYLVFFCMVSCIVGEVYLPKITLYNAIGMEV
jgi:hypothetical protein